MYNRLVNWLKNPFNRDITDYESLYEAEIKKRIEVENVLKTLQSQITTCLKESNKRGYNGHGM